MRSFLKGFGIAFLVGAAALAGFLYVPFGAFLQVTPGSATIRDSTAIGSHEKTVEERVVEAREKSAKIKALYMTADIASDGGAGATRLRQNIIRIAEETEINGIVIDVKEVCGVDYDERHIRALLNELHQKNIWSIARITVFKDASQRLLHPDWYLARASAHTVGTECGRKKHLVAKPPENQVPVTTNQFLWQDKRGGYWLDPASPGAREYILGVATRMIDLGFDELQFDYIRFPSDGDVGSAIYPVWDQKTPRYEVLKSFFVFLHDNLKQHKTEIMLSADLFGYVAAQREDATIGQRLDDIGHFFDYVSFMVYPSHYYSGLYVPANPAAGTAAKYYTAAEARRHPDITVGKSLEFARDFLDGKTATTSIAGVATGTTPEMAAAPHERARLRPWLEDFFHEDDKAAGRPYGAQKVRMQIDAAEGVEDAGWLLWNAANVYTEGALKKAP